MDLVQTLIMATETLKYGRCTFDYNGRSVYVLVSGFNGYMVVSERTVLKHTQSVFDACLFAQLCVISRDSELSA